MKKGTARSIEAAVRDVAALERAIGAARRQVIRQHRLLGVPLVIWQDGKVVEVPPESVELPADDDDDGRQAGDR